VIRAPMTLRGEVLVRDQHKEGAREWIDQSWITANRGPSQ
jgi:hypothetical protein